VNILIKKMSVTTLVVEINILVQDVEILWFLLELVGSVLIVEKPQDVHKFHLL
jgi:hypothetical protein